MVNKTRGIVVTYNNITMFAKELDSNGVFHHIFIKNSTLKKEFFATAAVFSENSNSIILELEDGISLADKNTLSGLSIGISSGIIGFPVRRKVPIEILILNTDNSTAPPLKLTGKVLGIDDKKLVISNVEGTYKTSSSSSPSQFGVMQCKIDAASLSSLLDQHSAAKKRMKAYRKAHYPEKGLPPIASSTKKGQPKAPIKTDKQ
jgi:hypothetical protein